MANQSINLTGNSRVFKCWQSLGRQVISPLAMKNTLVFIVFLGIACGSVARAGEGYVEVGSIPAKCPITITSANNFAIPDGWKISPQKAVAFASNKGLARCNSPLLQVVYADEKNYYIIKPAFGPMAPNARAVVVNGATGAISIRGQDGASNPGVQ